MQGLIQSAGHTSIDNIRQYAFLRLPEKAQLMLLGVHGERRVRRLRWQRRVRRRLAGV